MDQDNPSPSTGSAAGVADYFRMRWNGGLPLATLFWRDMVVIGTAVNLVTTLAAVLLLALEAPTPLAVAVHFAPLPWNIFLFASVWRATARLRPVAAFAWQSGAAAWLLLATIA